MPGRSRGILVHNLRIIRCIYDLRYKHDMQTRKTVYNYISYRSVCATVLLCSTKLSSLSPIVCISLLKHAGFLCFIIPLLFCVPSAIILGLNCAIMIGGWGMWSISSTDNITTSILIVRLVDTWTLLKRLPPA